MEWISVSSQPPEMTDEKWYGMMWRRVFFVCKATPQKVYEGHAEIRMNMIVFDPLGERGFFADEVAYWMPRPLPEPPKLGAEDIRELEKAKV